MQITRITFLTNLLVLLTLTSCNSGNSNTQLKNNLETSKQINLKSKFTQNNNPIGRVYGIAEDSSGYIYMVMGEADIVQKISPQGEITTLAGNGSVGIPTSGALAITQPLNLLVKSDRIKSKKYDSKLSLNDARGIAVDNQDNIYIADENNNLIEQITPQGIINIIAGGGNNLPSTASQLATQVSLSSPNGVAVDHDGNLFISDSGNNFVEKLNISSKMLEVIAGNSNGSIPIINSSESATNIALTPQAIAVGRDGNIYISDTMNNFIEKVNLNSGLLNIVAGNGNQGRPSNGLAVNSNLGYVEGITLDLYNNLYLADEGNNVIEKIDTSGNLSVIIGNLETGSKINSNPLLTSLDKPYTVAIGLDGLYIGDTYNQRLEKLDLVSGSFYVNTNGNFNKLVGPFQCINDKVTGNDCGCLYDSRNQYTWYANTNQIVNKNSISTWVNNGAAISNFNLQNHCNFSDWHIPSAPLASINNRSKLNESYPGGEISQLVITALKNGYAPSTSISGFEFWFISSGFFNKIFPTNLNTPTGIYEWLVYGAPSISFITSNQGSDYMGNKFDEVVRMSSTRMSGLLDNQLGKSPLNSSVLLVRHN